MKKIYETPTLEEGAKLQVIAAAQVISGVVIVDEGGTDDGTDGTDDGTDGGGDES